MNDQLTCLPSGKIDLDTLSELLTKHTWVDERIAVGAKIGEDATVIDMGDHYVIAKTDPITFVTTNIGYYAVNINANDVACMGGVPKWFLVTLLLPNQKTAESSLNTIFEQISSACKNLDIVYCGGHTEVTDAVERPLVVGQMLGEVDKENLITSSGAQQGDRLIVTKGIPIEATSIIAREKEATLADAYATELVERCKNFIYDPGISVLRDAQIALGAGEVHALHDPTEGGLATGIHELARASNVGIHVELDRVLVLPEGKLLCDHFGLNPLGSISSGTLLVVTSSKATQKILDAFEASGIAAADIGKVIPAQDGVTYEANGITYELPIFPQDEILKIYS